MSQTVIAPIDVSQEKATELALPYAVEMAQLREATLRLVTVMPDVNAGMYPYTPMHTTEEASETLLNKVREIGRYHVGGHDVAWEADVVVGRMPRTLIEQINTIKPAMVVMPAHEPGWTDYLLGSVSDYVVRHVHCPVLVVRDPATDA
ncbi:universal stress protein [Salinisphaera orenii]|uniref:universal stress protein n=1 Tax=Salinisphaera orenii TaxID=856731 RepID=UPI000DBE8895